MEKDTSKEVRIVQSRWSPIRIILVYILIGIVWILISDKLLAAVVQNPDVLTKLQTYKGWFFIAVTAWVLYLLINRYSTYIQLVVAYHKKSEESLKDKEAQLQLLISASNIGLWDWDLRTDQVYFSPVWKRQIGYEDHEISNKFEEWQRRVHPDDLDRAMATVKSFIEKPWPDYENEFRFRHKDGSYRWILTKASLEYDDAGQAVRVVGCHIDITERKRMETVLIESEAKLRNLFEQASDGIFVISSDNRYIDANLRGLDMLGYTREELLRIGVADVLMPQDRPRLNVEPVLMMSGIPHLAEWAHLRKDGSTFPGEVSARKIDDQTYLAIVRDLTARREAEATLRESDRKYRELVEHANSIILRWTHDGIITFMNEFGQNFFGYSEAEIIGRHVVGTIVPETESTGRDLRPLMDEICAHPERFECNVNENMRKNGERVWISWTNKVVLDEKGQVKEILSIGSDITDRKQAEEERRQRSAEIEAVSVILYSLATRRDLKEILNDVLRGAISLTGLEGGTLCLVNREQKTLSLVAAQNTSPEVVADLSAQAVKIGDCLCGNVAETGEPLILWDNASGSQYVTLEAVRNEGIRFHAAFPLMVKDDVIGVLCLFARSDKKPTDRALELIQGLCGPIALVIENARLFQEIKDYADELENRVAQRTLELEAKNRELETFSYSVSHDLKAPLRGIDGYSRLLLQDYADKFDDDGRFFLNTIRNATGQMTQLIDDLLAYSKLERRAQMMQTINPGILVEALISDRKDEIAARNVTVSVNIPFTTVIADPEGLSLALRNLLDNALKFTHSNKSPHIDIGGQEAENTYVLWVKDNGIGFDPKYGERIFDMFHRLHRAEDFSGIGIGLAMVRKAMERMGGRAWAEGEPGEGAMFYLAIPKG